MTLKVFKTLWGCVKQDGGKFELSTYLKRIKSHGSAGVECSVGLASKIPDFSSHMIEQQMQWIPVVFSCGPIDGTSPFLPGAVTAGPGSSCQVHFDAWRAQVETISEFGIATKDIPFVASFTGHDSMSLNDAIDLFDKTESWFKDHCSSYYSNVMHETHRGRALYSPWVTRRVIQELPDLQLVADLSHFTCVTEWCTPPSDNKCTDANSMERDMLTEVITELAGNFGHIHGRIGSDQSPQVPDPRSSKWKNELQTFEHWWEIIWKHRLNQSRDDVFTFTTEHGPPPYQQCPDHLTMEETQQVLSTVEEINTWLGKRAQERFIEIQKSS